MMTNKDTQYQANQNGLELPQRDESPKIQIVYFGDFPIIIPPVILSRSLDLAIYSLTTFVAFSIVNGGYASFTSFLKNYITFAVLTAIGMVLCEMWATASGKTLITAAVQIILCLVLLFLLMTLVGLFLMWVGGGSDAMNSFVETQYSPRPR